MNASEQSASSPELFVSAPTIATRYGAKEMRYAEGCDWEDSMHSTGQNPPTTNHQPPTTNHQPPTTNHQPPTTNHQPPTTNHLSQCKLQYANKKTKTKTKTKPPV